MPIALITARMGSKRLKKKNIKTFFGKPVISYPIEACIESKIFDRVIVSTDNKIIANISKRYSAEVPFLRAKRYAGDNISTLTLIRYLIKKMKLNDNHIIFCVYPVTPFINPRLLRNAFKNFNNYKCDFLFTVVKGKKSDKKKFSLSKNNIVINYNSKKNIFKDAGQFYIGKVKSFLMKNSIIFSGSSKGIILSNKKGIDVNTYKDWINLKKNFLKK